MKNLELRVFVTRNTEYHLRGDLCVAVRDRKTGAWLDAHRALGQNMAFALHYGAGGATLVKDPQIGDALCFGREELVTSSVLAIKVPSQDTVSHYRI